MNFQFAIKLENIRSFKSKIAFYIFTTSRFSHFIFTHIVVPLDWVTFQTTATATAVVVVIEVIRCGGNENFATCVPLSIIL